MANREIRKIIIERKGSIVTGEHFVGRNTIVLDLVDYFYCTPRGQNLSVCGLPRVGKTSLLRHAALMARNNPCYDSRTLIVYIDLNAECRGCSIDYIYDWIIAKTLEELRRVRHQVAVVTDTEMKLLEGYAHSDNKEHTPLLRLQKFMEEAKKQGLVVKMVLDEFDTIMKSCQKERNDKNGTILDTETLNAFYACLRLLITDNDLYSLRVALISRNKLSEMEPPGVESKLSGVCTHTVMLPFKKKERRQYWEQLKEHDDEGLITTKYIQRVESFASAIPYWLDVANDCILRGIDNEMDDDELEDSLYSTMREQYDSVLRMLDDSCYLDQSGSTLKRKLLQLMVGPRFNLTPDDITRLEDYAVVTQKQKEDGTNEYRSLSTVFEDFIRCRPSDTPVWDTIHVFELKMRQLIKERYLTAFDGDWIKYYTDKYKNGLIPRLKHDQERSRKLFGSTVSHHLADYLYMRDYYTYFINDNWDWFRQVFRRFNGDKVALERQMTFLCDVRNPLAHANGHFLSAEEITRADEYCRGLSQQIDAYLDAG